MLNEIEFLQLPSALLILLNRNKKREEIFSGAKKNCHHLPPDECNVCVEEEKGEKEK